ncbi:MAG TPA: hypothetical protein VGI39_30295 [Polyangiaceae bacterium]
MIGTKTLSLATVFVVAVAGAALLGTFAPGRLATRGFEALELVGCFGVVVGTLMFGFWRLGERSGHYVRATTEQVAWDVSEGEVLGTQSWRVVVGENREGEAVEFPVRVRLAVSIGTAAVLALAATDSRAIEELGHASHGATSMASSYCPDEEPPKPKERDPNEPGCELVRRAYALGYAKTLGKCAPKEEQKVAEARPPCTRRQRDEPLLHYSFRHLAKFAGDLHASLGLGYFQRTRQEFKTRVGHLGSLEKAEQEILTSAPHAAHHIWTNLPDPQNGAFEEQTCTTRYLHLPHRPTPPAGPLQASLVFEQVLGQLLFEATYDPAAGHCREYHVHWGAPLDACAKLAQDPAAFLAQDGSMASVKATLERYRVESDLAALGGVKPPDDPSPFFSFQCYFEGAAEPRKSTPFTYAGRSFTADELRVPPARADAALYIDRYDAVGNLLVAGFRYGSSLDEGALEESAPGGVGASFVATDDLLTRLYELESIDLYRDPSWIEKRPDLLEVYPYETHLKHYVQVFRRQYRRVRGRL